MSDVSRPSVDTLIERLRRASAGMNVVRPLSDASVASVSALLAEAANALAASLVREQNSERVFQAVVYAFEGKDVPEDLREHGFVKRGRKFREAAEAQVVSLREKLATAMRIPESGKNLSFDELIDRVAEGGEIMSWEDEISIATRERCGVCHNVSPIGFHVPDDVWLRAVPDYFRHTVLCLRCFTSFADERMLAWDREIEFFPVSLRTHLEPDARE